MNLPENISEQEFLETFQRVIGRLAHRYTFASYDVEDIEQEAFIIALNSLDNYDPQRSLESFLYVHLNNRLKNFKRDNYYRYECGPAESIQDDKKNILEAIDIHELLHVATSDDIFNQITLKEISDLIDEHLPANMRSDYLKIKNKGKITKSRRNKVIQTIKDIINVNKL